MANSVRWSYIAPMTVFSPPAKLDASTHTDTWRTCENDAVPVYK